ncbi:DsbE family thiol:disulfide interchange protein [Notoacmeibacter ruber]|uniref:DsbE family thiol:disulfide interchange protein n=1 Tax=Notoacmeibacter ruber TaxID=2670375 RepID=A0A3L7JHK0_9HYPH|nr:DsbE family thiol:disulfide interchange protein [Notoacmeibacter ruber]RLQ89101.1 DsbE family thiol:disulfide interchange protein [Notoacmeibacter ruber]
MKPNETKPVASVKPKQPERKRAVLFLPVLLFAIVASIFLAMEISGRDSSTIPSALIGQPAPRTTLTPLEGMEQPGLDTEKLKGKVTLVNIFASWCAPCRQEHPVLMRLAEDQRVQLVGFNYKDDPDNARRFLSELGNPYQAVGVDPSGRAAIDWGVYGVPETFLLDREGVIVWKYVGPLTPERVENELMPLLEETLQAPASDDATS